MKINEQVTVGPQPSSEEINQLREQGFKTVINFRTEGEEDQPLSPSSEGAEVQSAGMHYVHIPVSMSSLGTEAVDQFRDQFKDLPKPLFAHCKSGKRAGAMVMMHMAAEQGMTGDQTLEQAQKMGFKCDQPELKQFVRQYVDSHGSTK